MYWWELADMSWRVTMSLKGASGPEQPMTDATKIDS